jgi:hypothetical protein
MIEFAVSGIEIERYAVTPTLAIKVRIVTTETDVVHSMALRCQVRIDPQRRGYDDFETAGLLDLFGARTRWSDTQRPFLWGHTSTTVPGFAGSAEVSLPFPITYDLEVAGAKYLHAVRSGHIPLSMMFSGTAFLKGDNGFRVQQIPWDTDCGYLMPAYIWHDAMEQFFPGAGWIRLQHDTLDALTQVRSEFGMTSWEETFRALLIKAGVRPS